MNSEERRILEENGFTKSPLHHCSYIKESGNKRTRVIYSLNTEKFKSFRRIKYTTAFGESSTGEERTYNTFNELLKTELQWLQKN